MNFPAAPQELQNALTALSNALAAPEVQDAIELLNSNGSYCPVEAVTMLTMFEEAANGAYITDKDGTVEPFTTSQVERFRTRIYETHRADELAFFSEVLEEDLDDIISALN